MGLLDTTLRATIHSAVSPLLLDGTYTAPSSGGTYTAGAWSGATAGSAVACKGCIDTDVSRLIPEPTNRRSKHRRVLITQLSLAATPEVGGKVTFGGVTVTVLERHSDPASATWELLAEV